MKKKVLFIVLISLVAIVLTAGIVVVSVLGAHGYFAYKKIDTIVSARTEWDDDAIFLMSANIRRQEKWWSTSVMDTGTHRWYKRADYYLQNIREIQPDIFGAQEVQARQYEFLTEHLKGYKSVVQYRDNKGTRSESCPIFYNAERFELVSSGTYWLSETPDVMSRSWKEKGEYRIVTYAELRDTKTGDVIAVFNSHPDWEPEDVRKNEIQVIADKAAAMIEKGDKVVVFGDLNSDIHDAAGAEALASLDAILTNAITLAGEGKDYGYTFNGYDVDPHEELDYFFLPEGTEVLELGKIDKTYNGVFPSDHFPIYAKVKF